MAKKKDEVAEGKILTESKSSSAITIEKFIQLHGQTIHRYTRAYVEAEFRGIMKTPEEWSEVLGKYMEGDK